MKYRLEFDMKEQDCCDECPCFCEGETDWFCNYLGAMIDYDPKVDVFPKSSHCPLVEVKE